MDDQDLIDLQREVFNQDLSKQHITALKQIVVNDHYDESQAIKGIDFEAFKTFMKKYIQKMKGQTCWKLLKHFGYDAKLQLKKQLYDDKTISDETLENARSFELTQNGIMYIQKLFTNFKGKNSKVLDETAINHIFSTCPPADGLPFDFKKEGMYEGNGVTMEQWIGLWQKVFCENPKEAYRFLVYTGYIGRQMKDVIFPIMIKTRDILGQGNQHRRFIFNCFVIGHSSCGKSSFIDATVKKKETQQRMMGEEDINIDQNPRD